MHLLSHSHHGHIGAWTLSLVPKWLSSEDTNIDGALAVHERKERNKRVQTRSPHLSGGSDV